MDRKIEHTDLVFGPAMLDPDTRSIYWEVQVPELGLRKIMAMECLVVGHNEWNAKVQEVIDFMNEELEVEKEIREAEKEQDDGKSE